MPTSPTPKVVHVKVTNGSEGEFVVMKNVTQGWKKRVALNANVEAVYNPTDDGYTLAVGDVVLCLVSGRINQVSSGTVSGGGLNVTLGNSATTSMANVDM